MGLADGGATAAGAGSPTAASGLSAFLRRQCRLWVKTRKSQSKHKISASPENQTSLVYEYTP
jgi:hypothetical protein